MYLGAKNEVVNASENLNLLTGKNKNFENTVNTQWQFD